MYKTDNKLKHMIKHSFLRKFPKINIKFERVKRKWLHASQQSSISVSLSWTNTDQLDFKFCLAVCLLDDSKHGERKTYRKQGERERHKEEPGGQKDG